jgi:hypothetical protein
MIEVHKVPIVAPEFQSVGPQPNFKGSYLSNQKLFCSTEQTGTGSAQNIAHGLGKTPAKVFVSCTDNSGSSGTFTVAEGSHTATNVVVTVTAGAKYKVLAWL